MALNLSHPSIEISFHYTRIRKSTWYAILTLTKIFLKLSNIYPRYTPYELKKNELVLNTQLLIVLEISQSTHIFSSIFFNQPSWRDFQ